MEKLYLAIEIGATKQQLAIGTRDGSLLETLQEKIPLPRGAQDVLDWIERRAPELIARKPCYKEQLAGVAAGFGGPLQSSTGKILSSIQVQGWENFKLREWLREKFALPATVINDTVAGGFAELHCGKGRGYENVFYTNIGSGIGGALFINRQYYDGAGFGASYFGNSYIPNWHCNTPGVADKVENICSGLGIEKRLREPGYVPQTSLLFELCAGNSAKISCLMLENAAKQGDRFALEEVDRIARSYSIGLCNVLALTAPGIIIVGGGVAKMGDLLLNPVRGYVDEMAFIANRGHYTIVQSLLLDEAVIVGAVICAARAGQ